MPETIQHSRLAQPIESLLARLRRRIRAYVWAEGLALALIVLGVSFWASLVFDWTFEPPPPLRIGVLALFAAALGYVVYRYILRRAFVRLGDRSMAVLLERRFETLHDSLLTTVEQTEHGVTASPDGNLNSQMLEHTGRQALAATRDLSLGPVFNTRPLKVNIAISLALLVTIVLFGVAAREEFGIWVRRSLLMSEEYWPRRTRLNVVGFESGRRKIARGSDLELAVTADASTDRVAPEIVEIRYRTNDGARGRENMSREGIAVSGRDELQNYSYTFKGVLSPIEFYVQGGDDRRGPLFLDVVDSPTINEMVLHCEYPAYTRRSPRDITVTGLMQVPRGTKLSIEARSNKPLVEVQVDDLADANTPVTHKLDLRSRGEGASQSFTYPIEQLDGDKTLLFTLHDSDDIRSRDPIRLTLTATPDEAPQVGVSLKGIGTAITTRARLPAAGEITDDYGVAKTWFEYHADDGQPEQRPFAVDPAGRDKLAVEETFDVAPLKLTPKQKFHLAVQAADAYALADSPNVGASQRYVLDVVTPEQLRSMLEARELQLRRRFETLMQEMTDTRDLLARVELSPPAAKDPAPVKSGDKPADDPGAKPAANPAAAPGAEPEDVAAEKSAGRATEKSPEQALASRRVQTERVLQNSERSAHETLGVASAFDEIRNELINNRVDTEELKTRLKDGISDPLRRISLEMFPELEKRLKKLQTQLNDPASGAAAQSESLRQADIILVEMRQVLDKMLELETFNEVLDLLRGIISSQEKVNTLTKEKQKQKVKDLLEE